MIRTAAHSLQRHCSTCRPKRRGWPAQNRGRVLGIRGTVVLVKKGSRASAIGAVGVVLAVLVAAGWWVERISSPSLAADAKVVADGLPFEARRLSESPILQHTMDERLVAEARRYGYVNVNGPSLIRVPPWVENPLGRYYLYFAHHKGETIRLAYADRLEGPWNLYTPGVLELHDSGFATEEPETAGPLRSMLDLWRVGTATEFIALTRVGIAALEARRTRKERGIAGSDETRPHIASPDVLVDHERREIRMYYHGLVERRLQMSRVAASPDGLRFRARPELITSAVPPCSEARRGLLRAGDAGPAVPIRGRPDRLPRALEAALCRQHATRGVVGRG